MAINVEALQETFEANGLTNVWCDRNGRLTDENATPQQLTLAAQLRDAHDPNVLSLSQQARAASTAIQAGKNYLRRQLVSASPDSLTTLVNTIKPVVDSNTYLLRMVNNKIDVMSSAYAWTAASVKAPATAADRARYIEAVMQIIALLA